MLADRRPLIPMLAAVLLSIGPLADVAQAQPGDPVADSAVFLLRESGRVAQDGRHNALLRSLRQLRDPALRPYFYELARSDQAALQIHGLLGVAELDEATGIDLAMLAQIEQPEVQGEVVTAALDGELLTPEQANQIVAWPGLNDGVKILIAASMFGDVTVEREALREQSKTASKLGRRGLASLMLLQMDQPGGIEGLQELDRSGDTERDVVRAMLLNTALRHDFDRVTDWARAIAADADTSPILRMLALQAAMRFGDEQAYALWETRLRQSTDVAELNRLALVALQLSPYLPPRLFDPLIASDDPMLRGFGQAGQAVAAGQPDASERVLALLELRHPLAIQWLLRYAAQEADVTEAQIILLGLIYHVRDADRDVRGTLLNQTVLAAETLHNLNPDAAIKLLRPVLVDPQTDPLVAQAILLGLLRSTEDGADRVLADHEGFINATTQALALLLRATRGQPLTDAQIADLGLVVGSNLLEDTLRMQAAWCYLKYTDRDRDAIAELVSD